MKRIYLDNASTTPVYKQVVRAIKPYLRKDFGNPSSIHYYGIKVNNDIEKARVFISNTLGCDKDEIFFTSGASESNSWISKNYNCFCHKSSHDSIKMANKNERKKEINTISLVNSETGIIYELENYNDNKLLHLDITQAIGKIDINLHEMKCISASASAHKFGGLKGCGFLYIKKEYQKSIVPLIYGHQENSFRGGTENVIGIIGMAKALEITYKNKEKYIEKYINFICLIKPFLDILNIKYAFSGNILNITFKNLNSQTAVQIFNNYGIAISAGSACNSKSDEPSETLLEYGFTKEDALKTIRVSFGYQNTKREIKKFLIKLKMIVDKYDKE